jgi:manganese/zinc/iron transport system substrate-binding protein
MPMHPPDTTPRFRRPRRLAAALAAALAATLALPAAAQDRPTLVATVGVVADLARTVAGDCATVTTLMGPGVDPHTYRATPSDIAALEAADAILYLGLGLEGQLAQVLGRLGERKPALAVGEAVSAEALLHDGEAIDPHVWMSPVLWSRTLPAVTEMIATLAPACAEAARANAERYAAELAALDAWGRASIASIPAAQRTLVTAHDAFGYMARDWGIAVEAVQGISTEAEASVADIAETARIVAKTGVPAVFVETTINPRNIEAVIAAARDLGHTVTVGGNLFADAMGDEGTPEGSYIGMIRANVIAITEALGGEPAPWPAALGAWATTWNL